MDTYRMCKGYLTYLYFQLLPHPCMAVGIQDLRSLSALPYLYALDMLLLAFCPRRQRYPDLLLWAYVHTVSSTCTIVSYIHLLASSHL